MKKSFTVAAISFISFSILAVTAEAQTLNATRQTTDAITSLSDIVNAFTGTLVKSLGTLAMAAAVVAFFYGIVQYIWGVREAKPDVIKTGNEFMKWGLVALFVMFSVYGIIKYGQNILFNGMDVTKITIPELNFGKGNNTGLGTPGAGNGPGSGPGNGFPLGTPGAGNNIGIGADCVAATDCNSGLICQNYKCAAGSGSGNSNSYSCSPGYECTLPNGAGTGLCNTAGNACESNFNN